MYRWPPMTRSYTVDYDVSEYCTVAAFLFCSDGVLLAWILDDLRGVWGIRTSTITVQQLLSALSPWPPPQWEPLNFARGLHYCTWLTPSIRSLTYIAQYHATTITVLWCHSALWLIHAVRTQKGIFSIPPPARCTAYIRKSQKSTPQCARIYG